MGATDVAFGSLSLLVLSTTAGAILMIPLNTESSYNVSDGDASSRADDSRSRAGNDRA
jgi:hypothetical protein